MARKTKAKHGAGEEELDAQREGEDSQEEVGAQEHGVRRHAAKQAQRKDQRDRSERKRPSEQPERAGAAPTRAKAAVHEGQRDQGHRRGRPADGAEGLKAQQERIKKLLAQGSPGLRPQMGFQRASVLNTVRK